MTESRDVSSSALLALYGQGYDCPVGTTTLTYVRKLCAVQMDDLAANLREFSIQCLNNQLLGIAILDNPTDQHDRTTTAWLMTACGTTVNEATRTGQPTLVIGPIRHDSLQNVQTRSDPVESDQEDPVTMRLREIQI